MFRKLLVTTAFGVAALVVAQGMSVQGARGRGVAMNANNHGGRYTFDVRKVTNQSNQTRVEGRFEFASIHPNSNEGFKINMRRAEVLGSNNNVAEFAGPAKLVRPGPNGPVVVEGRLVVAVQDNRNPNQPNNEPDKIRFKFTSPNAPNPIEFNGNVREGDINVFRRP